MLDRRIDDRNANLRTRGSGCDEGDRNHTKLTILGESQFLKGAENALIRGSSGKRGLSKTVVGEKEGSDAATVIEESAPHYTPAYRTE
jgi:hypothetical protein